MSGPEMSGGNCRRFEGKVALVTGAGSGIGAATAERLAAEGASLVLVGRREAPLREVAARCGNALVCAGDVASAEDSQRAVDAAIEAFGRIDVLVANAGIAIPGGTLGMPMQDWQQSLDVNLSGPLHNIRAVLPHFLAQKGGAIVLLSSLAGLVGVPGNVSYTATKTAVIGLARAIAAEFGPANVRCNAVCPGWSHSEMTQATFGGISAMTGIPRDEVVARLERQVPLRRVSQPSEIAGAIAFLASDDASYITGTTLAVDGGQVAIDPAAALFTM